MKKKNQGGFGKLEKWLFNIVYLFKNILNNKKNILVY